ncbi:MAG: ABC transporter permease [Eubacteriales bacterium]|nr:ABC transporter permease [Eubacteriales bacterium]
MIAHILKYRLKCFLRDRQMVFWTLLFPLLLATLFNFAFANLGQIDQYVQAKIAVVDNLAYQQNLPFQSVIEFVSGTSEPLTTKLFDVTFTDAKSAQTLLLNKSIDGYIELNPKIQLVVYESGFKQTIIKGFLDDFVQTETVLTELIQNNPQSVDEDMIELAQVRRDYLADSSSNQANTNPAVIYFYSLIAMTALYGGFWGLRVVTELQADLSPQGARASIAPVHKLKRLIIEIVAALVVHFAIVLVVILYMFGVLHISFGSQWIYVILAAFAGSLMGVSFGACIAALVKKGEGMKIGVLISSTMIMSFLSGMMYHGIKYTVTQAIPALAWLNPANVLTDAFYALYYYDTYQRYFINLSILFAFSLIFCLLTYVVLRRQKYASI